MARRLSLLALLAALVCCFAAPASAATNEVRFCGKSQGWEVMAGNYPPKIPQTKCSFARKTDAAVKEFEKAKGSLPQRFGFTVNGQDLTCTTKDSNTYAEVRCKNPRRFVLIYKFS